MDAETHGEEPLNYIGDLGIKDIGMSVPMGIAAQNVSGIYSRIRMGTGNIEIQFPGYRSGNRNAQTPGLLGEDQRQALRELSLANEVSFNTHASMGMMGLMGRDERGNFSLKNATQDLVELKRAIDFQSDMGGGSVVIHSGEFERPVTDMYMDDESGRINLARDSSGRLMFKEYFKQEADAKFELVDDRTFQRIETVQKNKLVAHPVWKRAKEDYWGKDQQGNKIFIKKGQYTDYNDNLVLNPYDPEKGRVPEFNPGESKFEIKYKTYEDFRREAEEYNTFKEKELGRELTYYEKRYPEEEFMRATMDGQEGTARGWALQFALGAEKIMEAVKKLEEQRDYYVRLQDELPPEEQWKIARQDDEITRMTGGFVAPGTTTPVELIDRTLQDLKGRLEYDRTSASGQLQSAMEIYENKQHFVTPIKLLERNGIRLYAEAGLHAMKKTKDPNDPVFVSIEHIFPERFGGHIEELKWIVKKARSRMVDMLTNPTIEYGASYAPTEITEKHAREGLEQPNPFYTGMSKREAEKIASQHIRATIDTGHINLWRKYWQEDPKLSPEQNDKKFNEWVLGQIESIAREGMVGNLHLADNYGYHDDHLSPGQGNSPIRPIVNILKKYGYDKAITVEPGADATTDQSDFHGLMKTWRYFGSSVYGTGGLGGMSGSPQAWGDIQHSYFGNARPPNYVFGSYSPSNDWTLWSQVPLE